MIEVIESSRIFGIAKQMNSELEKLPLAAHGAVLGMINTAAQHREIAEKQMGEQKQRDEYERQQKLADDERTRQINARFAQQVQQPSVDHKQVIELVTP